MTEDNQKFIPYKATLADYVKLAIGGYVEGLDFIGSSYANRVNSDFTYSPGAKSREITHGLEAKIGDSSLRKATKGAGLVSLIGLAATFNPLIWGVVGLTGLGIIAHNSYKTVDHENESQPSYLEMNEKNNEEVKKKMEEQEQKEQQMQQMQQLMNQRAD